jgi:hypothetical protein
MQLLPMIQSSCSLDEAALSEQLERYRELGSGARDVKLGARQVNVEIGQRTTDDDVEKVIATERSCCPFFELDYDTAARRLTISVDAADREPALAALAEALTSDRERARGSAGRRRP